MTEVNDLGDLKNCYVVKAENGKTALAITDPGVPLPVERVDQTTPWNDFFFVQQNGVPTALTVAVPGSIIEPRSVDVTRLLTVASVANISIGDWIGLFSGPGDPEDLERYYWSHVTDINGLVLTMGTLIDFPFQIGAPVISTTKNMNVDGSVTPQIFSIQAGGVGGDLEVDITRTLVSSLTASEISLAEFCDIPALANGMYLRVKENGTYRNKCIIQKNSDFLLYGYDWKPFAATNPSHGQDGLAWRFSQNGDDKHGAVSRISGGDIGSLQWVVQDDLRLITSLESVGANHEVD